MEKILFRFRDSFKYLYPINEMDILNSKGEIIFQEKYTERSKLFNWGEKNKRHVIDSEKRKVAVIDHKCIIIDKKKWELRQTKRNDYCVREDIGSEVDYSEIEYSVLGQWELRRSPIILKFDGVKFIENNSIIRGTIRLNADSKLALNTYCELHSNRPDDCMISSFLIIILHRYIEYRLMGHEIWTA